MTVAISIEDLTKTYSNGFEALKGISLQINQGDFFALLGPNGAGKSTSPHFLSARKDAVSSILAARSRGTTELVFGSITNGLISR